MKRTKGVVDADASFIKGKAVVTYDPEKTSPQSLVKVINTGTFYRASLPKGRGRNFKVGVRQMALRFERPFDPRRTFDIGLGLKGMKGVVDVNALPDGRVGITFDAKVADKGKIIARVEGLGYPVLGTDALSGREGKTGGGGEGAFSLPDWVARGLAETGSGPEVKDRKGGTPLPYWTVSGVVLLGVGLLFYRKRRKDRRGAPAR